MKQSVMIFTGLAYGAYAMASEMAAPVPMKEMGHQSDLERRRIDMHKFVEDVKRSADTAMRNVTATTGRRRTSIDLGWTADACEDEEGWTNKGVQTGGGYSCSAYKSKGWCRDGGFAPGSEWTGQHGLYHDTCSSHAGRDCGATYNYPEYNCCDCGKGSVEYAVMYLSPEYGVPTEEEYVNKISKESDGIYFFVCSECAEDHQYIWLRRTTKVNRFKPFNCIANDWKKRCDGVDNVLNEDFELYSSFEDLLERKNKWQYCDYGNKGDAEMPFPRNCGPTGPVSGDGDAEQRHFMIAYKMPPVFQAYTWGNEIYSTSNDRGKKFFNKNYKVSKSGLLVRECPSCADSHKIIYYQRLTNIQDFEPYDCMIDTWASTCGRFSNKIHVDFELYGSLEDLFENKPWDFCNYDHAGIAFPRDCGPTRSVHHQWHTHENSWTRGKDVTFYAVRMGNGGIQMDNSAPAPSPSPRPQQTCNIGTAGMRKGESVYLSVMPENGRENNPCGGRGPQFISCRDFMRCPAVFEKDGLKTKISGAGISPEHHMPYWIEKDVMSKDFTFEEICCFEAKQCAPMRQKVYCSGDEHYLPGPSNPDECRLACEMRGEEGCCEWQVDWRMCYWSTSKSTGNTDTYRYASVCE